MFALEMSSLLLKLSVRNLGVIIENCFCMEQHVKKICTEANYHLRNISKIRNISSRTPLKFSSMLLLVLSLSTVTHFCMVFQNTQFVDYSVFRIRQLALLTRKYDSITPIMFKLHWLPVHSRIIFKLLLLVYKALNGKAPSYISSLLSHRKCSRSLRSSGQELLTVPLAKLKTYGDRRSALLRQGNGITCLLAFVNLHQSLFLKTFKDLSF